MPDGNTKTICKVKGLRLNYETLDKINFDVIKEMVLSENIDRKVDLKNFSIQRTGDNRIFSTKLDYTYKVNVTKRRKIDNFDTLPFGYVT